MQTDVVRMLAVTLGLATAIVSARGVTKEDAELATVITLRDVCIVSKRTPS